MMGAGQVAHAPWVAGVANTITVLVLVKRVWAKVAPGGGNHGMECTRRSDSKACVLYAPNTPTHDTKVHRDVRVPEAVLVRV